MVTRLRVGLLIALVAALCSAGAAAPITIDGDLSDWQGVTTTRNAPAETVQKAASPRGAVSRLWVAHDARFLYFRVDFAQPRPWAEGQAGAAFVPDYHANMR